MLYCINISQHDEYLQIKGCTGRKSQRVAAPFPPKVKQARS